MPDTKQKLSGQHCWRDDEFFSDSALSWKYDCWRYYCLVWYVSSQATTGVPIPSVAQIRSKSLNENASPLFFVTFPNLLKALLTNHQKKSERSMEVTEKSNQGQKELETLASHDNHQLTKPVWKEDVKKATRRMTLKTKATRRRTLTIMLLLRELMRRRQALRFPKVFNGLRRVDDRNHQCYYNPTACFWFTKICIIYEFRMREGLKGW